MTIIIIDDSEGEARARTLALQAGGFAEVRHVRGGAAGLTAAREPGVELVLIGTALSDVCPFDLCRRLREHPSTAHLAVLLTAGPAAGDDARLRALTNGADLYVDAPCSREELVASVAAVVGRRRRAARLESGVREVLTDVEKLFRLGLSVVEVINGLRGPLSVLVSAIAGLRRGRRDERVLQSLERAAEDIAERLEAALAHVDDGRAVSALGDPAGIDLNNVIKGELLVRTCEPFLGDLVRLDSSLGAGLPRLAGTRDDAVGLVCALLQLAIEGLRRFVGEELVLVVTTAVTDGQLTLTIHYGGDGYWPLELDDDAINRAAAGSSSRLRGLKRPPEPPGPARMEPPPAFHQRLAMPRQRAERLGGELSASWVAGKTCTLRVVWQGPRLG